MMYNTVTEYLECIVCGIFSSQLSLDIDECKEMVDNCHDNAVCINTPGRFGCLCSGGFSGDGIICIG